MTFERDPERGQELARLWQGSVVPVEEERASEARRARIVSSLGNAIEGAATRRRKERSRRRLGTALALAAGVALAIGIGREVQRKHDERARTAAVSATGRSVRGPIVLVRGVRSTEVDHATLELGDGVRTRSGVPAEMALGNIASVEVAGASELSLLAPGVAAHRLRLDRGRIAAKVDDRPSPSPKLVVETPDVDVVVTGTILEVDVVRGPAPTDSLTAVSVTKGRVVVRRAGVDVAVVTAGQRWVSAEAVHEAAPPAQQQAPAPEPPKRAATSASAPERKGTLAEENSLFQEAVDARSRGDHRDALERLSLLLSKYPGSPLAGEARIERMRAFKRLGQTQDAVREARRYLADFPEGFASAEARRLVMQEDAVP